MKKYEHITEKEAALVGDALTADERLRIEKRRARHAREILEARKIETGQPV